MSNNTNLHDAKTAKNDEFYTQISDIEKELKHYKGHFKGKTVLCNCDDPFESSFFKYFVLNFNELGLKKLLSTCYAGSKITGQQLSLFDIIEPREDGKRNKPYKAVVTTVHDTTGDGGFDLDDVINLFKSGENTLEELKGDGDFRSEECLALLDECDICCTNPPFSLWREYIALMIEHEKKFVVIGSMNAITYKEFFPLLKDGKVWSGYEFNKTMEFIMPDTYELKGKAFADSNGKKHGFVPGICWFTNLDIKKRHEKLVLWQRYYDDNGKPLSNVEERYPHYDNYDAIEVGKIANIPSDYYDVIGVPITYLGSHNPDEFEIIGMDGQEDTPPTKRYGHKEKVVNGQRQKSNTGTMGCVIREEKFGKGTYFDVGYPVRAVYKRILIRRKVQK